MCPHPSSHKPWCCLLKLNVTVLALCPSTERLTRITLSLTNRNNIYKTHLLMPFIPVAINPLVNSVFHYA